MKAKALFTVKCYREFSGRFEITLFGFMEMGKTEPNVFRVPISHNGYDYARTKNRFLKKMKAWSLRSGIQLWFDWKIEQVEPSHNGFKGHWARHEGHQWSKKRAYTKGSNGKWYYRAECRADTALHHRNCGLPVPQPQIQGWKWDA